MMNYFVKALTNNWERMIETTEDPNEGVFYDPEYFAHKISDEHR